MCRACVRGCCGAVGRSVLFCSRAQRIDLDHPPAAAAGHCASYSTTLLLLLLQSPKVSRSHTHSLRQLGGRQRERGSETRISRRPEGLAARCRCCLHTATQRALLSFPPSPPHARLDRLCLPRRLLSLIIGSIYQFSPRLGDQFRHLKRLATRISVTIKSMKCNVALSDAAL